MGNFKLIISKISLAYRGSGLVVEGVDFVEVSEYFNVVPDLLFLNEKRLVSPNLVWIGLFRIGGKNLVALIFLSLDNLCLFGDKVPMYNCYYLT